MVKIEGYDIVATAMCDFGIVTVLNNNSDSYLVGIRNFYGDNTNLSSEMEVLKTFTYRANICPAYRAALNYMSEIAMRNTDDDSENCPGCGRGPGDGPYEFCNDPEGCGYWKEVQK